MSHQICPKCYGSHEPGFPCDRQRYVEPNYNPVGWRIARWVGLLLAFVVLTFYLMRGLGWIE